MNLRPISHYSSAKFEPNTRDICGYPVHFTDTKERGRVDDLIVDGHGTTRYADVAMKGNHYLVPIGYLRTMPKSQHVRLRGLSAAQLKKAPTWTPTDSTIDDDTEAKLEKFYDHSDGTDRTYAGPEYRGRGWRTGEDREVAALGRMDDYEIADDSCDPRGWEVVDAEENTLGTIDHLVGDTKLMKVTFLALDIDDDLLDDDRLVLVPVGYAELDEDREHVHLRGIDSATLLTLPAYEEDELTPELLTKTRTILRSGRTAASRHDTPRFNDDALSTDDRDVRVQRAEEELLVGKRREDGAVTVEKTVHTEKASGSVRLRNDEVSVERVEARDGNGAKPKIGAEEIRVPVVEEELVTTKRPVVKEEIVVKRRRGAHTERVTEDVAKERVEVKREGVANEEQSRA